MRIALVLTVLFTTVFPCSADAESHRIRGATAKETQIIRDLLARSRTAQELVAAIERTDVIVYVQLTSAKAPGQAATRLAAANAQWRYLRIVIGAMTHPRDRAALLAHELQHALEIGRECGVRDDDGLRRLYSRIGEDPRAVGAFETTEARRIGLRVRREIGRRQAPPDHASSTAGLRITEAAGSPHALTGR